MIYDRGAKCPLLFKISGCIITSNEIDIKIFLWTSGKSGSNTEGRVRNGDFWAILELYKYQVS